MNETIEYAVAWKWNTDENWHIRTPPYANLKSAETARDILDTGNPLSMYRVATRKVTEWSVVDG